MNIPAALRKASWSLRLRRCLVVWFRYAQLHATVEEACDMRSICLLYVVSDLQNASEMSQELQVPRENHLWLQRETALSSLLQGLHRTGPAFFSYWISIPLVCVCVFATAMADYKVARVCEFGLDPFCHHQSFAFCHFSSLVGSNGSPPGVV